MANRYLFIFLLLVGCGKEESKEPSFPFDKPEITKKYAEKIIEENVSYLSKSNFKFSGYPVDSVNKYFAFYVTSIFRIIDENLIEEFFNLKNSLEFVEIRFGDLNHLRVVHGALGAYGDGKIYLTAYNQYGLVLTFIHELCHYYDESKNDIYKKSFSSVSSLDRYPLGTPESNKKTKELFAYSCSYYLLGGRNKHEQVNLYFKDLFNKDLSHMSDAIKIFKKRYPVITKMAIEHSKKFSF